MSAGPTSDAPRAPISLAREDGRKAFGDGAAGYHASRSGYPDELYDHIRARVKSIDSVLEVGPGSGLATAALLGLGPRRFVGVEPDPHFVEFLRGQFTAEHAEFINAPFPCEGLTGPFDLAACAAAFHWLDAEAALSAVRRLLRPGGLWAMWWNSYLDETDDHPFARAAMNAMRRRGVRFAPSFGAQGHLALDVDRQVELLSANGFGDVDSRQWRHARPLDAAAARTLFDSFSFVRLLPVPDRAALLDEIAAIVDDRFGGEAESWVSTACYTARPS